jgi:hypothetical protein
MAKGFRRRVRWACVLAAVLLAGLAMAGLWAEASVGLLLIALLWYIRPSFQSSIEAISPDLMTRAPQGIREMRLVVRLENHPRKKQLLRAWRARRRAESRALLAVQGMWLLPIVATLVTVFALVAGSPVAWLTPVVVALLVVVAQSEIAHACQQVARWKCRRQATALIEGFEYQRRRLRHELLES